MISISDESITPADLGAMAGWLLTNPQLTKGPMCDEFERAFAQQVGTRYGVLVNSGSSANLLLLWSLVESGRIQRGCKVVVPALCWATDMAPLIQLGFEPVVVDINLSDLGYDLEALEVAIKLHKPSVVLNVTPMGLLPEGFELARLCDDYGVLLLEDNCDSFGGACGGMGEAATWSFYWGHQISTVEGGMVTTDNCSLVEVLRSVRSHGWSREFSGDLRNTKGISPVDLNEKYTFYHAGFNLRSTEMNAFFGLRQLKRCAGMIEKRRSLAARYRENLLDKAKQFAIDGACLMGWPMLSPERNAIQLAMLENDIESRPLLAGDITRHPAYQGRAFGAYPNAHTMRRLGFYVPLHPGLSTEDIDRICEIILQCTHPIRTHPIRSSSAAQAPAS